LTLSTESGFYNENTQKTF
jgi:hypothetical protein